MLKFSFIKRESHDHNKETGTGSNILVQPLKRHWLEEVPHHLSPLSTVPFTVVTGNLLNISLFHKMKNSNTSIVVVLIPKLQDKTKQKNLAIILSQI